MMRAGLSCNNSPPALCVADQHFNSLMLDLTTPMPCGIDPFAQPQQLHHRKHMLVDLMRYCAEYRSITEVAHGSSSSA